MLEAQVRHPLTIKLSEIFREDLIYKTGVIKKFYPRPD